MPKASVAQRKNKKTYYEKTKKTIQKKPRNTTKKDKATILALLYEKFKEIKVKLMKSKNEDIVKTMKKVNKLLNHERNQCVTELPNSKRTSFSVRLPSSGKTTIMPGLLPELKSIFYPFTEDNPFKRSKEDVDRRSAPKYYRTKTKGTCNTYGNRHGETVHKQIEMFVKLLSKSSLDNKEAKILAQWFSTADPCTIRILTRCLEESWLPVASELKIWDETIWIQTSIDLLVFDFANKTFNLIELKTGYENEEYGEHTNDPKFPPPFEHIPNCPLNRHMLQLVTMKIMLKKKYKVTPDRCFILRALPKQKGTTKIPLANWCKTSNACESIYNVLKSKS